MACRLCFFRRALHIKSEPLSTLQQAFTDHRDPQLPPWHTNAALVFLATDITCLLAAWLTDAASTHSPLLYSNENSLPAADVDSAVGRYLMALNSAAGGGDVVKRLTEVQREIRRRF